MKPHSSMMASLASAVSAPPEIKALAGRGSHTSDEANDGLLHVGLAPHGGFGFVWTTDFTNHDDGIGVWIVVESLHHFDVLQTVDGVTTDTDGAGLTQAHFGQHGHSFVSQCART
jgi:hypothetical protein